MKRSRQSLHGLLELETRLVPSNTPPTLVKDIFPGASGSVPSNTLVVGSKLYFAADDGITGNELWVSDGTSLGTTLVLDLNTETGNGAGNSFPNDLTEVNGRVFFTAIGNTLSGRELWVSDGTAAGTKLVTEINTTGGSNPQGLVNVNGILFFSANDGVNGRELWTSDGTATGTKLVTEIQPGTSDGIEVNAPRGVNVGGTFFFAGIESDIGTVLWTSDGTAKGTAVVNPGQSTSPFSFIEFNGKAAFVATAGGSPEVFLSDGTASGTLPITNFKLNTPNAADLTNFNGLLVFRGFTNTTGFEPFISDGTLAGTKVLNDIAFFGNDSSPLNFSVVGSTLYFSAQDFSGGTGRELWKTDGTSLGTTRVTDLNPGFFSSNPSDITNVAGVAYFAANGGSGYELWRTDGTTTTLIDVEATSPSFPASLAAMGNRLFFKASRSDVGGELFKLDEDNVPPVITSITSPNPNGSYYTGASVTITVTFSEPVTLTGGNLILTLDTGDTITITPFSGTTATATYTAVAGHFSSDLTVTAISTSGSVTFVDDAGNPADLSLPALNLGVTSNIMINLPLLPPTISTIPNQSANAGTTVGPLFFMIGDLDSPATGLTLSVTSSNPSLIPPSAVTLVAGGGLSSMTVVTQPGLGGVATLRVTVTDPDGNSAFTDVVFTINGTPSISDIPDQTVVAGTVIGPLPFTIGDAETLPDNLTISVTSDNPSFLPASAVTIAGTGSNRTITIVTPGMIGGALLTITVTDEGGLVSSDTIAVDTVLPPTISDIPDQTALAGGTIGPLPFTIGSTLTPAGGLILSATSNNVVIPTSAITFGGSGANRTITIATSAGIAANTTLTVTVTDPESSLSASDTIVITQYFTPTISDLPDQTVIAGNTVGPLAFIVGGGLSPVNGLLLSVSSGNSVVIPASAVTFGGSGANRTITIATTAGLDASTVLTVIVTDPQSGLTASDTLTIVQSVPVIPTTFPFVVSRGPNENSLLKVFNSDFTENREFVPIEGYTNGLRSVMADFNGDGIDDVATGTRNYDGKTGAALVSRVAVFDGKTNEVIFELEPFGDKFFSGLYLSAGDINADGRAELALSAFYGGGSRIRVFSPSAAGQFTQMADFFGLRDAFDNADVTFQGGARTAISDFNGDGFGDLVFACGEGGGPRVAIYSGKTLGLNGGPKLVGDFFAMESNLRNGVHLAAGDINGDGRADLVVAPAEGGAPRVRIFSGALLLQNTIAPFADFFGGSTTSRAGLRIAVKNLDGDNRLDLLTGSGPGDGNLVSAYHGSTLASAEADVPYFAFNAFIAPPRGVWVG